jgi:Zn-finger nucleic acid-binding protein
MARMTFGQRSGVIVDVCRAHGTWFDAGELDAVMAFVRGGGLETELAKAPKPEVDAEARKLEAALTVELLHEQQKDEEEVKDLVYYLTSGGRRLRRHW